MKGQKVKKSAQKAQAVATQEDDDDRFKEVFTDPRFMKVPKKVKKVEIDDRFKKGIMSKEFNMVAKVDKYGNKINKADNSMLKFYNINKDQKGEKKAKKAKSGQDQQESSDEDEEQKQDVKGKQYYDEDGKFKWEAQSSSEDDNQDQQDDEEAEESESNDDNMGQLQVEPEEDDSVWSAQEDENQATTQDVKVGKRLALTNMDWDSLNATDILSLFSSFCKGDMLIQKVEIYPSLFGLEQMKNDALYGPPKQLFDELPEKASKKKAKVQEDSDEFIDDEEKERLGYNSSQLRKYELQKMKYFYAVIYCNNKKTASKIYDEYNGFEFEMSNIRLNLSFIDDELTFPQKVKEAATEVPAGYVFNAANSLNKALNHTNVKLTWDQTDPKRLQKFQKLLDKDDSDIDEDEYKEFLASASEDEAEEEAQDKDKIEEYRRKLLGALSSTTEDISNVFRKRDLQGDDEDGDGDKKQLDIKFNVGFGEDIGKKLLNDKKEKKEKAGESEWQKYQRKRKEKRKEKKLQQKQKKEQAKIEVFEDDSNSKEAQKQKAELEMLIGRNNNGTGEFKPDTKDQRFQAVLKNKDFALDPTHKNFRKVADGEFVKEQKVKRRKMHEDQ